MHNSRMTAEVLAKIHDGSHRLALFLGPCKGRNDDLSRPGEDPRGERGGAVGGGELECGAGLGEVRVRPQRKREGVRVDLFFDLFLQLAAGREGSEGLGIAEGDIFSGSHYDWDGGKDRDEDA